MHVYIIPPLPVAHIPLVSTAKMDRVRNKRFRMDKTLDRSLSPRRSTCLDPLSCLQLRNTRIISQEVIHHLLMGDL
jgi:hypothetical protein